jgi:hypothetical protein
MMTNILAINPAQKKKIIVADNFYANPDGVREYALQSNFIEDNRWYKGKRSELNYATEEIKVAFENLLGQPISQWDYPANGKFQYCTPEDLLVYHCDLQKWAAVLYLTPDAPYETGTNLYAHKTTGFRAYDDPGFSNQVFSGGFYDATKFDLVDTVGNVYNRVVIFDAHSIHAAAGYFGNTKENARLFQIFFFD